MIGLGEALAVRTLKTLDKKLFHFGLPQHCNYKLKYLCGKYLTKSYVGSDEIWFNAVPFLCL
jgi:hypothetical protein